MLLLKVSFGMLPKDVRIFAKMGSCSCCQQQAVKCENLPKAVSMRREPLDRNVQGSHGGGSL